MPGAILLIDPVVPEDAEDAARLWRALDRDVERLRRPVCAVATVHWHRRGADEVIERYDALDGVVPDGATAIPLGDPIGETAYSLRHYRALVPGTSCSAATASRASARRAAAPVPARLVRPHRRGALVVRRHGAAERAAPPRAGGAERVLVTHGTPLLSGGAEALRALAAAADGRRAA